MWSNDNAYGKGFVNKLFISLFTVLQHYKSFDLRWVPGQNQTTFESEVLKWYIFLNESIVFLHKLP